MKTKKMKEQIEAEKKLIDDFVATFKLGQHKVGEKIKDKHGKEYTFKGSGIFDLTEKYDQEEREWLKNGMLDKEITYSDDKYDYIITLAPFKIDQL